MVHVFSLISRNKAASVFDLTQARFLCLSYSLYGSIIIILCLYFFPDFQEQGGLGPDPGGDRPAGLSRRNPAQISGPVENFRIGNFRRANVRQTPAQRKVSVSSNNICNYFYTIVSSSYQK